MKSRTLILIVTLALNINAFADGESVRVFKDTNEILSAWADEVNAKGTMLWSLAAERFRQDAKAGRRWIMTTHAGNHFRAFTDGNLTVVSIPHDPAREDKDAKVLFCNHYNVFWHVEVDQKIKNGKFGDAKSLLELLASLEPIEDSVAVQKLKLLSEMEIRPQDETLLKEFLEITGKPFARPDFAELDEIVPLKVTDLKQLPKDY